jgi:hypothetical protein
MKFSNIDNINILNFTKNLVLKVKYMYLCNNGTHSASREISKWVLYSGSHLTKDNTPSRLTSVAHLGGLLFYKHLVL